MMKIAGFFMNLIAKIGVFVFFALLFYLGSNRYYLFNGKQTDFSILAWLEMLSFWGISCALWVKYQKPGWGIFTIQLSLICFAFDCWRLNIYAQNQDVYLWILGVLACEGIACLVAIYKKCLKLFEWCLSAGLVIWGGKYIICSLVFSDKQMLMMSGVISAVMISLWVRYWQKRWRNLIWSVCGAGVLFVLALLGKQWAEAPGIKFWEKPVTEVSSDIKVSVVVPVYNVEQRLKPCLDSLRKQNLKEIEVILVNDGSTDGSLKILEEYAKFDKRFKVITQENQYVGVARNTGIDAAKGEYVGFVDSDDIVSKNYYEELYKVAKKYDADLAAANTLKVDNVGLPNEKIVPSSIVQYEEDETVVNVWEKDRILSRVWVWNKIYKRSFLEKHNIRGTTLRTRFEDYYFTFQALMYGKKMAVAPKAIYYYLRYPDTISVLTVNNTKLDDKALDLAVDMDKLIRQADVDEEWRQVWLDIFEKQRNFSLTRVYMFLKEEDKPLWVEKCQKAFPDVDFDFVAWEKAEYDKKAKKDNILKFE